MAFDDKKKPAPASTSDEGPLGATNPWEFVFIAGIIILIISYFLIFLTGFLDRFNFGGLYEWFLRILPYLKILSYLAIALLLFWIFSTSRKHRELKKEINKKFAPQKATAFAESATGEARPVYTNKKWERVIDHLESENPNDWKIAIIEADSILNELVDSMGYNGASLGEKLKAIEQSDFTTLNNAWEAHKVRNAIAHEGSNFQLNDREARRVIALYESVFREFKYI